MIHVGHCPPCNCRKRHPDHKLTHDAIIGVVHYVLFDSAPLFLQRLREWLFVIFLDCPGGAGRSDFSQRDNGQVSLVITGNSST